MEDFVHQVPEPSVEDAGVVQRGDVGVGEARRDLRLPRGGGVGRLRSVQDLQRYEPVERRVVRLVDHAEAAMADRADDLVTADASARREQRRRVSGRLVREARDERCYGSRRDDRTGRGAGLRIAFVAKAQASLLLRARRVEGGLTEQRRGCNAACRVRSGTLPARWEPRYLSFFYYFAIPRLKRFPTSAASDDKAKRRSTRGQRWASCPPVRHTRRDFDSSCVRLSMSAGNLRRQTRYRRLELDGRLRGGWSGLSSTPRRTWFRCPSHNPWPC